MLSPASLQAPAGADFWHAKTCANTHLRSLSYGVHGQPSGRHLHANKGLFEHSDPVSTFYATSDVGRCTQSIVTPEQHFVLLMLCLTSIFGGEP